MGANLTIPLTRAISQSKPMSYVAYFPVRGVRPDRRLSLQLIGGGPGQPLFQSLRDVPMWIFQLRALDHGMLIIEPRGHRA